MTNMSLRLAPNIAKLETALAIATKKEAQVRKAKQLADKKKKLKKNTLRRHCQRNLQLREGKPRKQRRKGKGKRRGEKRKRKRKRQQERNHPANSISPVGLRRT